MQYTREEAGERLIRSYGAYYDITRNETGEKPAAEGTELIARCDYFEYSEKYVLIKKAKLWEADCEDFLYLFSVDRLTAGVAEACRKYVWEDGASRIHVGPGHMYSYITMVILCDAADEDARGALKKYRDSKSFLFSLHGWMTLRSVAVILPQQEVITNWNGREAGVSVKNVLYPKTDKRREK